MAPKKSPTKMNIKQKPKQKLKLVFDEAKRRDFLTGFHKRKVQRKKFAKEKLEKELKEERKRLKLEAKESYKKLVGLQKAIPELEDLAEEKYEDNDVCVKVLELSANEIAKQNHWTGINNSRFVTNNEEESDEHEEEEEEEEEMPGMEFKERKQSANKPVREEKKLYKSEKEVKKVLKKKATQNMQKSKVFQKKSRVERLKQKKNTKRQNHKAQKSANNRFK